MPQTIQAKDGTQLDASVVNLARAIRRTESGDKYDAKGASGEYGAYQWMPNNYESGARELGLDPSDKSPVNQDKVAYHQLKKLKDKGYSPEQVAAAWNAGEGSLKGDAWKNRVGVNKFGVSFDTPSYVNKVIGSFQEIKGQPMQSAPQIAQPQQKQVEDKSFARKAAEFAFPILEDKERTALQTVGDIGLSALWFVPGLGAAGSAALRGLGLGARAARTAATIGSGAAIGYGADVSQKLSEGKTGSEVLKPGLGTVLGAGTAGIASKVANRYSQKGIVEGMAKSNNAVFGQTKRGANELAESFSKSKDPGAFLAERGINLKQLVDADTVSYATKDTAQKVLADSTSLNKILTDALGRAKGSKSVQEIEDSLLTKVPKNHPERADIVRREMQLLKQQYGDNPSIADLNEWKHRSWGLSKFDMAVPNDVRLTYRMIGNALKTDVEDLAAKAGLKNVKEFNELVGAHLDAADMLEMLHGTKAKGGRLGNLMMQESMRTIGGVGGMFGAGPVGLIAGAIAGHYGADIVAALIRKVEGAPIKSSILKRIEKEEPEIVRQFQEFAKKAPEELQQLKQQLSEAGIDIFKDKMRKSPTILSPKENAPGTIQGLITTFGARAGAQ